MDSFITRDWKGPRSKKQIMQDLSEPADVLVDNFGRTVNYVRISVTDRCDFRCIYCMEEDMDFLPRKQLLTLEELAFIGKAFCELGVTKIRVTGGEPLVRNNVVKLFEDLGKLPGLHELVTTTNGSQLSKMAGSLKAAGVKRINISLDTLDDEKFRQITRVGDLQKFWQVSRRHRMPELNELNLTL